MARASALHAEGHRFDSDILHKLEVIVKRSFLVIQVLYRLNDVVIVQECDATKVEEHYKAGYQKQSLL